MLNERLAVARSLAGKIREVEQSLTESMRLLGELMTEIPAAKAKLGNSVSLNIGVEASENVAEASLMALKSFKLVTTAHSHLAQDRHELRLPPVGWGWDKDCPDIKFTGSDEENIVQMKTA